MKYTDILPERHDILRQIHELEERIKELDAPILELLAQSTEAQQWANPMGYAEKELKKMHKKHDPKL